MNENLSNSALLSFLSAAQPAMINPALAPGDVKLDHRDTADLLAFIARLGEQFNYYNTKNEIDGDWKSFFDTDKHALLALMIEDRREMEWQRINDLVKALPYISLKKVTEIADFCWGIFEACFDIIFDVNQWYVTFTKYHTNDPFQIYLKESIWQEFSFSLRDLYNLYHKALLDELITDRSKTDPLFRKLQKLEQIWNFTPFPFNPDTGSKSVLSDLSDYTSRLESAIKDFYNLFEALRTKANAAFDLALTDQSASPHISLIIAFLELYKYQQKALNSMVGRHMRFYYKDVLDFDKKGASPDSAFVLFELGKTAVNYALPAQTLLAAGQDSAGNAIQFETTKSVMVTPSHVGQYLGLYSSYITDTDKKARLLNTATITQYDSPATDKLTGNFVSFPMFGNTQDSTNITTDKATIGFAISSPELMMEGGDRELKITFQLNTAEEEDDATEGKSKHKGHHHKEESQDLTGLFDFSLTAAKSWMSPFCQSVVLDGSTLVVELGMNQSVEATAAYNSKTHGEGFDTPWPVLKATVATEVLEVIDCKQTDKVSTNPDQSYDTVENLSFTSFTIESVVNDSSAIKLVVGSKKLPANSTVAPFGSVPEVGSRLLISSYEVFIKHTEDVCIATNWVNLPNSHGFAAYYEAYNNYLDEHMPTEEQFKRSAYKARLEWLDQGQWQHNSKDVELFKGNKCKEHELDFDTDPQPADGDVEPLNGFKAILHTLWTWIVDFVLFLMKVISELEVLLGKEETPAQTPVSYSYKPSNFIPDYELANPPVFTDQSKSGFFAIELREPKLAFGNSIYPQVVTDVALFNTVAAAKKIMAASIIGKIVNAPVKLVKAILKKLGKVLAKFINIDPKALKDIGLKMAPNKPYAPKVTDTTLSYTSSYEIVPGADENHQYYKIHPFGIEQATEPTTLLPQYPEWGYVFLGFSELQYNTTFNLFLGIEDRLDTKIQEDFTEVTVELLTDTGWVATEVFSDSTYGLNISGIISFQINAEVTNDNPIMPTGQYWIRLSADQSMVDNAHLIMMGTNAAEVTRVIDIANQWSTLQNVDAGTITNLSQTVSAISKVVQPFKSFGGEEPQTEDEFYQSVAARIGNKGRGGSLADYQALILDEFKEIYQVNIVPDKYAETKKASNRIDIAVVPVVDPNASTDPYRPIAPANDLSEVMLLLQDRINPHLELEVQHAGFEELTFSLDATFTDAGQFFEDIDQLNSDLKDFVSPWIDGNDLAHQREALYTVDLIKFIRSRSYIASFSNLSILLDDTLVYGKDMNASTGMPMQVIAPVNPLNILVSAAQHDIKPQYAAFVPESNSQLKFESAGT